MPYTNTFHSGEKIGLYANSLKLPILCLNQSKCKRFNISYYQNVLDELKSLITTEFPRLSQPDRVKISNELTSTDLGYQDLILLRPLGTGNPQLLSTGKLEDYNIALVYLNKLYRDKVDTVVDFYEDLDKLLVDNSHGTYWYQLTGEVNIEESIDDYLPEDFTENGGTMQGFILNLTIKIPKF